MNANHRFRSAPAAPSSQLPQSLKSSSVPPANSESRDVLSFRSIMPSSSRLLAAAFVPLAIEPSVPPPADLAELLKSQADAQMDAVDAAREAEEEENGPPTLRSGPRRIGQDH
jgi:hypothetical protein